LGVGDYQINGVWSTLAKSVVWGKELPCILWPPKLNIKSFYDLRKSNLKSLETIITEGQDKGIF
jgi:hypothetical protein